jgi:type IV pilus assembly protein PilN
VSNLIKINLLPPEQRQPLWPVNSLMATAGIIVIVLCLSIYGYSFARIWLIESDLQQTRSQLEALRPVQEAMAAAASKQQAIDKKNSIIVALGNSQKSWSGVVRHLSALTADKIWFTELGKNDRNQLKISGLAVNYPDIAEFMSKLEADQAFTAPALVRAEQQIEPVSATKFEIVVTVKEMSR